MSTQGILTILGVVVGIVGLILAAAHPKRKALWFDRLNKQLPILRCRLGPKAMARRLLRKSVALVAVKERDGIASMENSALLYAQGALSFTQGDIEDFAALEFNRESWQIPLRTLLAGIQGEHIRKAHDLFANAVRRFLNSRVNVSLFEAGPGSGDGAEKVIQCLFSQPNHAVHNLRYEAVDVCRLWCKETESKLERAFGPEAGFQVKTRRRSTYMATEMLQKNSFDVILSGYSLHHNQSLPVVLSALESLPGIVDLLSRRKDRQRMEWLARRTLRSMLKTPDCAAADEVLALAKLVDEKGHESSYSEVLAASRNLLLDSLRDPRGEIVVAWAEALKPGGLLLVADPDGRSWFNRRKIIERGEELIAAANLSDREKTIDQIQKAGFEIVQVLIQYEVRTVKESRGEALDLPEEWWGIPTDRLTEQLISILPPDTKQGVRSPEDVDFHLGYVICARKPSQGSE